VNFSYSLTALEENITIPTWIELDETTGVVSGKAPTLENTVQFQFYYVTEWMGTPPGTLSQLVTLNVTIPANKTKSESPATAAQATALASASAQGTVAATAGFSFVGALLNGSAPVALWFVLQQLQMVILLLLIDPFTPDSINDYLEGVGFAMFDFGFISDG
jgi:hypothetical protein